MDPQETAQAKRNEAERLQQRADQLATRAKQLSDHASGAYGRFAGGQPLLVGHHSYRSALRDRDRADNATRRAIEARKEAEHAQSAANRARIDADLAEIKASRTRPWNRTDFMPGDIVEVRTHLRNKDVYRVKRVNAKTLTLEGPGGGMDDPKSEYDRVLSRTRDGVTTTSPTN
ncbi:DUF3560 domain-containing protein [Streptomyces sp. LHD-70]|uniref:DUF3560 domain-containing protein n=1 Tax=Streptomyces sp. LHD-70 TaxID=3072140 RepID=UPI00280FEDDF|nr:DUF3560 domain-containing protein [Streptomyces sp. LHD-70]MDQ8707484.1 DUF3560 domain-containing protein [Streptomyces sp. LHD-70]